MKEQETLLCGRIRAGDKAAFEYVFKTYYKYLCAYANQMLSDSDLSEEVVQTLFFHLWEKRESFSVNTSLKSYLFRAVHNSCMNYIRHHKIREIYAENIKHEVGNTGVQPSHDMDLKALQHQIARAVDQLPPERKKVFMMIRFEERKYKEVADILGISVKTVENQMGKAMAFLRLALKDYLPLITAMIVSALKNINHLR